MTITKLKTKLLSVMETSYVALKLRDENSQLQFEIYEYDGGVYDAWDWQSPSCYSIIIQNKILRYKIKGSINPQNGECVLEIQYGGTKKATRYLLSKYEKYKEDKLIRSGWAYEKYNYSYLDCSLYFDKNNKSFFEILEGYLQRL